MFSGCDPIDPDDPGNPDKKENGTERYPFKVANLADLKRVATGEKGPSGYEWKNDKCYLQVADIDLETESDWTPICRQYTISFSGTYDGGGFTISNLTILGDKKDRGLFGVVKGTIKNVRLNTVDLLGHEGCGSLVACLDAGGKIDHCAVSDIDMKCTSSWWSGGMVGENRGTISNCMITNGKVKAGGGLVGINNGLIENCYSTVTVNSGGNSCSGLVWANEKDGLIQNCYITGNVTSTTGHVSGITSPYSHLGGGKIQNCVVLSAEIKRSGFAGGDVYMGRIFHSEGAQTLINNYARSDMRLIAITDNVPTVSNAAGKDGADITEANYHSNTWWQNTAKFPASSWNFPAGKLPTLKGFDGLMQNPAVQ
jgi:hypothetical protein